MTNPSPGPCELCECSIAAHVNGTCPSTTGQAPGASRNPTPAAPVPTEAPAQYALDDYQPGQWWLEELEALRARAQFTQQLGGDGYRAVNVALQFIAAVFAERCAPHVAQQAQPAPAREPLTDAQIELLAMADPPGHSMSGLREFARDIERAHGITHQPKEI